MSPKAECLIIDISGVMARRTAEYLMRDDVTFTEAELEARLSVFPRQHVDRILVEARRIKQERIAITSPDRL